MSLLVFEQALTDYLSDAKVLFTVNMPHYIYAWEILRTIKALRGSPRLFKVFTPENMVITQWMIEDDLRQYRQTRLLKADFNTISGRIQWPSTNLEHFVNNLQNGIVLAHQPTSHKN